MISDKIQKSLKNKQGENKKVFFIMMKYYKEHFRFFSNEDSLKILKDDSDLLLWKQTNERTINRYKQEIRKLFRTTIFNCETKKHLEHYFLNRGYDFDAEESLVDEVHSLLRSENIEIPSDADCKNFVDLIFKKLEKQLFESICNTLTNDNKKIIETMFNPFEEYSSFFEFLKQNQAGYHFESIEIEIKKIEFLKIIDFNTFGIDLPDRWINRYVRKFLKETPAHLKRRSEKEILALSVLFLFSKYQETVDGLLGHLRQLIFNATKKGRSKEKKDHLKLLHSIDDIGSLYDIAEVASLSPNKVIKKSIYVTVPLVKINKILNNKNGASYQKNLSKIHASSYYKSTIRSRIFDILSVLDFESGDHNLSKIINEIKCENLNFFEESKQFLSRPSQKFINSTKGTNLFKVACEFEFLKVLSKKLNHKEVWMTCSKKYNNPQKEVVSDFYENKELYFDKMGLFKTGLEFTKNLQKEMSEKLTLFNNNSPSNEDVLISKKNNKPWIKLSPIVASPENPKLLEIKEGILQKWGMLSLIDIINEVDLRADFVRCFKSVGSWSTLSDEEIRKRIIVVIYGLGTNLGLKSVAQIASLTLEELRHIKRYYLSPDNLRDAIKTICNHMFLNYDKKVMGALSKGLCADSTQMTSFEDNILTQWSGKHKKPGIMIYWHLNLNYICVFSQIKNCGSSEVASMLHGFLYHGTELDCNSQYTDSHGQSELGFALSLLLNFDLLPRIKDIGNQKLYIPYDMNLKNIDSLIKRKINWKLIEDHYDEMVQIVCALKYKKTTPDSVIRQFSASNFTSPLFKAFKELGRCQKTIFLCRYLNDKELRVEINAALNIVENWNSMMGFVRFAHRIEFRTNSIDEIELNALCLHLIQLSITYINMICIQNIAPEINVTAEDKVSLVFYKHINPYGTIDVSFKKRLNIGD
jgi:TnpA family transposase